MTWRALPGLGFRI
jgi:hypothetical protein